MRNEKSIVLLENLKGNLTKYIYIYIYLKFQHAHSLLKT